MYKCFFTLLKATFNLKMSLIIFKMKWFQRSLSTAEGKKDQEKKNPTVNREFFDRLRKLLKIMIPGLWTLEAGILSVHTISLAIRTFLSIYVAKLEGTVIRMVNCNFSKQNNKIKSVWKRWSAICTQIKKLNWKCLP